MAVRVADKIKQLNDGSFKLLDFSDIDNVPDASDEAKGLIKIDGDTIKIDEETGAAYAVGGGGSEVIANPTLIGTENDLTGLQVSNVKYKVSSGQTIQYENMPQAYSGNYKQIVQYTGDATATYEPGKFYRCISTRGTNQVSPGYGVEYTFTNEGTSNATIAAVGYHSSPSYSVVYVIDNDGRTIRDSASLNETFTLLPGKKLTFRPQQNAGVNLTITADMYVWKELEYYVQEPNSEGTSGQVLKTDGEGGRYWDDSSSGGADPDIYADTSVNLGRMEGSTSGHASIAYGSGGLTASQVGAVALGAGSTASGPFAVASGTGSTASGPYSHAEGEQTIASGEGAHAEGGFNLSGHTTASGKFSHAEGDYTQATGAGAHSEGGATIAAGIESHAEGHDSQTTSNAAYGHAEGFRTISNSEAQHVEGRYNIQDNENKYLHIAGNGSAATSSNAHTLDWQGNAWFAGEVEDGDGNVLSEKLNSNQGAANVGKAMVVGSDGELIPSDVAGQSTTINSGMHVHADGFNTPDYDRVLTTITTAGASYTATEDCWLIGQIQSSNNSGAYVQCDGNKIGQLYLSASVAGEYYICAPIQKNSVITTRSDAGVYNLTAYANKSVVNIESQLATDTHVENNQDTPVGTIIPFFGTTAPAHYLACDGSVYNISAYPDLAEFIKNEFGSYNYFGGDGTTTFGVPDLQGEFLRGTGTNSHPKSGNGADVGEHQEATRHIYLQTWTNNNLYISGKGLSKNVDYSDIRYNEESDTGRSIYAASSNDTVVQDGTYYASRPTNTSVLWCIKAEATYYLANQIENATIATMDKYSTDEKCIGCWTDGKPIYRKVVDYLGAIEAGQWTLAHEINALGTVVTFKASCFYNGVHIITESSGSVTYSDNTLYVGGFRLDNTNIIHTGNAGFLNPAYTWYFIIEYTKTTDSPNSFTIDMLSNVQDLTLTAAEVQDVIDAIEV